MKGSVVALVACFALFFAAPAHSYSVKFITEDDHTASRRDAESGSDTPAGVVKTVEADGGAGPGDSQTDKSNIRKRDTRSVARDTAVDTDDVKWKPLTKELALYFLQLVGDRTSECYNKAIQEALDDPEEGGVTPGWSRPPISRVKALKLLRTIRGTMSACLREYVAPITSVLGRADLDDDTPGTAYPLPDQRPFFVYEFLSWLANIYYALSQSLGDAIDDLGTSQGVTDAVQRSSDTAPNLLADLMGILSQIDGGAFVPGEQSQAYPAGQVASPYPDALSLPTAFKKSNFLDKSSGYRNYANLPAYVYRRSSPLVSGYRGEMVQPMSVAGIAALPEGVVAMPDSHFSLLDLVLDKINSIFQGRGSPAGNMQAAPVEGLRDDANRVLGLYRGPTKRQSLGTGMQLINPDFARCTDECIHKRA